MWPPVNEEDYYAELYPMPYTGPASGMTLREIMAITGGDYDDDLPPGGCSYCDATGRQFGHRMKNGICRTKRCRHCHGTGKVTPTPAPEAAAPVTYSMSETIDEIPF